MKNENKFLGSKPKLTNKPVTCHKCGQGENNAIIHKGMIVSKTGGTTLRKIGKDYICTGCNKTKLIPRRERRGA